MRYLYRFWISSLPTINLGAAQGISILHGAALGLTPERASFSSGGRISLVLGAPKAPAHSIQNAKMGKTFLLHRQKNPVMLVVFASPSRSDLLLQSAAGGSRILGDVSVDEKLLHQSTTLFNLTKVVDSSFRLVHKPRQNNLKNMLQRRVD